MPKPRFTARIWREGDTYVAACVEVDGLVSQGTDPGEALANLREATELWFQYADIAEKAERYHPQASEEHFDLVGG